jgi:hypothetical protein
LILTDANGVAGSTQTGSFGYFRFEEIEVGQSYTKTRTKRVLRNSKRNSDTLVRKRLQRADRL